MSKSITLFLRWSKAFLKGRTPLHYLSFFYQIVYDIVKLQIKSKITAKADILEHKLCIKMYVWLFWLFTYFPPVLNRQIFGTLPSWKQQTVKKIIYIATLSSVTQNSHVIYYMSSTWGHIIMTSNYITDNVVFVNPNCHDIIVCSGPCTTLVSYGE